MVTDSLGTWELIGILTPKEEWQLFNSSLSGEVTLRFTYSLNWFEWNDYYGCRSYGLIRFYYPTPIVTVSSSYKIFPKKESEIRKFDTPIDSLKELGVKRIHYPRQYKYFSAIPLDWQLKVEQFLF